MSSTPTRNVVTSSMRESPGTPTPRKRPHCSKCGAPMLGHKRGQCHSPSNSPSPKQGEEAELETKMKALALKTNGEEEKEKERKERTARRRSAMMPPRADTLVSLSSGEKAALELLGRPGMMTNEVVKEEEANTNAKIAQWLVTLPQPDESRKGRRTPRPSEIPPSSQSALDDLEVLSLLVGSAERSLTSSSTNNLHRTFSTQKADDYLASLHERATTPVTQIYSFPLIEIEELAKNATERKLHARVIFPQFANGDKEDGWLVIGKDRPAVEEVFERVKLDVQRKSSGLTKTLGSGAVGAVATWLILAYS